jgi:RNA binding exosome subunit
MEKKSETKNLMDGLMDELNRNRELLKEYEAIGRAGMFGAHFIKQAINNGEQAIRENDVIKMLQAYSELKETK